MGEIEEVGSTKNSPKVKQNSKTAQVKMEVVPGEKRGVKRSIIEESEVIKKKLKLNGLNPSSQTPLALLNELRTGLNYKIEQADGPPHSPNFLASVEVDGIVFNGSGNSKKLAKQRSAEAALLTLCPTLLNITNRPGDDCMDFTVDSPITPNTMSPGKDRNHQAFGEKMERVTTIVTKSINGGMNPIMGLNELFPGAKYDCVQESSQKSLAPFMYSVTVGSEEYRGSGISKKAAKAAAARNALMAKYRYVLEGSVMMTPPSCPSVTALPGATFSPLAANDIAEEVQKKYAEIMKDKGDFIRRKVLAAIVMTTTADSTGGGRVISIGTGTKTVSGDRISTQGSALNDSHAEIVSRRGLLRFLYNQLSLHSSPATGKDSIFVYNSTDKMYKLKPNVRFHLYISTTPCGDARIFSPHDSDTGVENSLDRHPNRQSRGQLRTKIESGEGTIPVKSFSPIQTWDGVMQGERLLTMSCSDKVGKWNVVGVQGALLSHFIEPIYLYSLVVGALFHPTHLRRAMFSRIENTLEGLPPPFRLNKILMNTTSSQESRHTGKAPSHSVNWIIDEEGVEIVNATTGKVNSSNDPSRLCKQRLFGKFYGLLNQGVKPKHTISLKSMPHFYADVKAAAVGYQEAKGKMVDAFVKAGLGYWLKKPLEQDQFELDVTL